MSYCLNPDCQNSQNPAKTKFCQKCGTRLLLAERYLTIKLIGAGGFGRTFMAEDEYKPSKPRYVVKQFHPSSQGTDNLDKAAELFQQEAVRLDELGKHPQIPELFAHFEQDNRLYIVQEFIDGQNLAQELAETGAFREAQIRTILRDLLPVLELIHKEKVIHRDIKPENIIRRRSDDRLVLVDFGAAKYASSTALAKIGTTITVISVAFSPDGETLASGGGFWDKTIKLWDVRTGREKLILKGLQRVFVPLLSALMDK